MGLQAATPGEEPQKRFQMGEHFECPELGRAMCSGNEMELMWPEQEELGKEVHTED